MGYRCGPEGRFSAHFRPLSAENSQVSALSSPQVHDREPTRAALIAAAAGKDLVDDACAKKAVAELTRD